MAGAGETGKNRFASRKRACSRLNEALVSR